MSKRYKSALDHDLAATIFRISITQDNSELRDLLPEQISELIKKYPEESLQHKELRKLMEK